MSLEPAWKGQRCPAFFDLQGLLPRMDRPGISLEVAMPLLKIRSHYLQPSLPVIERESDSGGRFLSAARAVDVQHVSGTNDAA